MLNRILKHKTKVCAKPKSKSKNPQLLIAETLWCILKKHMRQFLLSLTIILLTSCGNKIDQDKIDNLDKFIDAKNILLKNMEFIKLSVDYEEYDSIKQIHNSVIINSNQYYFENTISKENSELNKILSIWDNGLIEKDNVYGTIFLNKDSIVAFTTKFENGMFSGIGHYIVFNPTNSNQIFKKNGNEILELTKLDNNWYYLIQRKNFVD